MNVQEAIDYAVAHFAELGTVPSHCDVRCLINDLVADNKKVCSKGYDQNRAYNQVKKRVDTIISERLNSQRYGHE